MAGKVVTTSAPTKQETAAAKSYIGSTRASQSNGLNVREKAGSDASKVNYYKGSAAHSLSTSSPVHQRYMDRVRTGASRDELFAPLQEAASYLNSGNRNSQSSSEWLRIANDNAKNEQDEEIRGYWAQMANDFRSALASDYSKELGNYKQQLSKLQDEDSVLSGNLKNASRSVEAGMYDTTTLKAYDDGIKQRANNKAQQAELSAKIAEIEGVMFDTLATDEVKEARARLTKDKYDAEWGYLAPGEAVTQRDLDQQMVDQFMESIGQQTQYYNFADRANAVLTRFGENLAGSAGNLAALGLSEADFYNSLPEDMRALVSDPEAMSKATPEQLAQIQAYREQFDANTGNGGRLAAITDKAEAWADQHDQQAAEEIRKAKQGLGKLGQFGIDLASTALDVGFDAATGLGLGSMAARVMGSSVGEARRAGATTDQQIMYGLTNTAIELLTEKMTDGLGMVYGKGVPTDIAEKVINKLAKTDAGANLLRLLNAGLGEGAEEVVSDLLSPFAQWIIDENARDNRIYDVDPDQLLYDFLLGSAMGLVGGGQEALSGGFAQSNAEYKAEEQARFDKMYEEGAQFTDKDVRDLNRLESRIDSEPQNRARRQAEKDMPGQTHSRLNQEDNKTEKKDALGNPINRMRRITDRTARVAEKLGYGNKTDRGEAYKIATGKTIEEANAEAEAESWQEAHTAEPVSGGDAARVILSNYSDDGLVEIWREGKPLDKRITSADFAEEMVRRELWTEKQARRFLGTVKNVGAPASERHRAKETDKSSEDVVFTDKTTGQEEKPIDQEQPKQEAELPNDIDYIPQNAKEYAVRAKSDAKDVVGKIKAARESGKISGGFASKVKWSDFAKLSPGEKLTTKVGNFFKSLGNKVKSNALDGQEIIIDERSVKDDIAHGISRAKACTFKAVPDVLAKGVIVDDQKNWKGRGYDTKIIAAPVEIDGKPAYVGCVVRSINDGNGQRFYLHEVIDGDGNLIFSFDGMPAEINQGPGTAIKTGIAESDTGAAPEPVETSIPQEAAETQEKTEPQETSQNAPETQAVEEGTPVAPEEEKSVKPQEESTEQPTEPKAQSPVASGTTKESDSEALRKQTARGEEKAVRDSGATFVSKTNADRSRIADHQLRDENWDNEINRLLSKDERWDDQDVVTAERAMYKMIRAIRDYQLGNKRKMPRKAFDALKERYNNLTLRHIEEKSKAGQELQATYQFTPAERIMNRMAKTFLGFAKDGTFAGNTNLAVNAKIYAAAEDAANRITEAVEAKDAQALAQICKDISDIRGVKNMFGIASKFASKVENEILDSIAKQENGVEALETLALGNLNAICDDVQPYKVVNAAKTIRVMNMLSNMSTIMNNITNNIASGLTSTNALAQGSSLLASKAFEKITGQKVLTPAAKGWIANKEIRNAEMEALKMATLVQMYGVNQENGKLEISGDKGLFNPNANAFEQTMAMYKFFIGMGVEATDQVKTEGLMKAMNIGIDKALAQEKITEKQAEAMRKEAEHEVRRLLYKDDNRLSGFVQGVRNKLNKVKSWGNDDIGTIGLGDIAMAFAKVPANVVRARLYATPEGCLVQLAQYTKGVMKAKRMHSEVMARQIMEDHAAELKKLRAELQDAKELETRIVGREAKDAKIEEINKKIAAVNRQCWNEAREKCSGGVYNKLVKKRDNYGAGLDFDDCVQRCKYDDAKEMSQFEAATYSRKIGKAATSAGMVALGAVLRGLGALRDFDQEPDDELRKMYKQKGYSGLMFNWSAIGRKDHEWRDGDIILDADFLEVVAMPLAIGACARECAMNVEGKGKTKAFVAEAAASGLSKTFEAVGDIPGMADAVNLYNAITSQFNTDNAAKGNRVFNAGVQYLANTLPSFFIPNAYTQLGAGADNVVRDTYTTDNIWQQAGNIMLNKTAFLRKKIPASVDMWGEERQYGENKFWGVVNKTLLPGDRIKYRQNKYESEIIRLTKEGYKGATPKLSVSGSFEVDGETYTMDADEKRAYRQNRNTEQAEVYQQFMDSPEYAMLTDDQKVAVLKDLKMDCERDAKQAMLNDRGLDVEVTRAKWETELKTTKAQITYLSMKQLAGAAWDSEENRVSDYAAMDSFLKDHYGDMTKEMREILDGSMSQLDKMYDARKVGIDSEMWQKAYDIYRQYNSDEGEAAVDGGFKDWEATEMWTKMEKATGADSRQMNWFEENMGLMRHMRVDPEHYQDLTDKLGWSRESASNLTKSVSELQPSNGNKTVSYKQRLRCIAESKGTTDDQKWEAFYEYCPSSYTKIINGMTNLRNRGYTYEQALKTYKSGKNSMWWKYEGE